MEKCYRKIEMVAVADMFFFLHKVDRWPARMCINKDEVMPVFVFSVIYMNAMLRVTRSAINRE